MNLPNKITMGRIVMAVMILLLLCFPFYQIGISFPEFLIFKKVTVDLRYIIAGVLFIIAAISDSIDGHLARSRNLVTDFGKVMDAIADKVLVNGVLIILACNGFISVIIPVVIVTRDIFVDSIKMVAGNKGKTVGASVTGKIKTICMMVGISLLLFYNLPFELIGIRVADALIIIATALSVVSAFQYYIGYKDLLFSQK